ncbi:RtcB family protein [Myxococcaceae bacterium GXIMD 01537]
MDLSQVSKHSEVEWWVEPREAMRVPAVVYASEALMRDMDAKVLEQAMNVAALPGIVRASYAMPDAHWGYGFPIGGVAAFDEDEGVISAGGVGFDISCGVRLLRTPLMREAVVAQAEELADALAYEIPAGVGSTGRLHLGDADMDAMLAGGACWAVSQGYGAEEDLESIEEKGCMLDARPEAVSRRARERQKDEMGTLGSGNHYLEVQHVTRVEDARIAALYGLSPGQVVVSIHCGSRGLGHQVGTDYLREMLLEARRAGLTLPDRELACAPIRSDVGQRYLGAMRAGTNCALANRQILTHLVRSIFARVLGTGELPLVFDVSHNTCKVEEHTVEGRTRRLFVHRKGATRAFGPGHPELPRPLREVGQPVLIGGSMGTGSWVLAGTRESEERAFASACHGAGRSQSRHEALKHWRGKELAESLAARGILVRSHSWRGLAEEAPGAYKDVDEVVDAAEGAGLAHKVARLEPLVCVKG